MAVGNSVHVRLMGLPVRVRVNGTVCPLARKDAALLARLALDGPCNRAVLAAWLWPQASTQTARSNLRQRLSRLARGAGAALFDGTDPLALHASVVHDLPLPTGSAPSPQGGWGHGLLSGCDYSDIEPVHAWVLQHGEALRSRLWQALQRQVLELERQGDSRSALDQALDWLHAQPLDEAALRLVMGLHARCGDSSAAMAAFDHCAAALAAELGSQPEAASCALMAQVRAASGTAAHTAAVPPAAAGVVPPRLPPRLPPIALMRPPQLVGRSAELAALDAICAAGRVAVLLGEPGTGKSRLLDDWLQGRPLALRVGCRPGDDQVPYALLTRLLQTASPPAAADAPAIWRDTLAHLLWRVLPAWGPAPERPLQARLLAGTLHWALDRVGAAAERTVVVDDLQFADPASLEQLPTLLDALAGDSGRAGAPLRWVLALRPAEVPAALQTWLAGALGDSAQSLTLGPLDAAAVQTLLDTLGLQATDARLWAGTLHRHSGGHPLYLLQTLAELSRQGGLGSARALAALGQALPAAGGTRALVLGRIQQLGGRAQDLLHVAALAGQDFGLDLAAAVLAQTPLALADAWHELEVAHLINGERIAHDLVADAALQSVPAHAAPAWHASIAAHLAAHGGALPRIAAHWCAAARWAEAGCAFADAAAQIHKQLRKAEEAAWLLQAADCHAKAGDVEAEGEALFLLFRAQWARKHRQGILDSVARLQGLATTPRTAMWAQSMRGVVAFDEEPNDASLALIVGAQAMALALGDAPLALWLKGWEIGGLSWMNRPLQMLDAVQRTLPLIEQLPRDALACSALGQCGTALEIGGQPAAGLVLLEQTEARYRALGEEMLAADCLGHQSLCHFHLGRLDDAARLLEASGHALAQLNGGTAEPHTLDYYMARYWREQGRLGPALHRMLDVLARLGPGGQDSDDGHSNLRAICGIEAGLAYVRLGQPHRARIYVAAPRGLAAMQGRVDGLLLEAELARAAGQSITDVLQRALPFLPDCIRPERWRWRVELELSREMAPDAAVALLEKNLVDAERHAVWSAAGPTRLMLMDALRRAGRTQEALHQARVLDAALTDKAPMSLHAGEYALLLWHSYQAAGDLPAARRALKRGLARLEMTRRDHVPAEFQQSFLERNAVNRQLRTLSQRQLA